jgi:hypothetical protein
MAESKASGDSPAAGGSSVEPESAEAAATRSSRVLVPGGVEPDAPLPEAAPRASSVPSVDGVPRVLGWAAALSGLVLMFWYRPEPALAALSLLDFEAMSPLRWLRGVHFWAAVGLLVWGGWRVLELAGEKAYRRPRPGRWWRGLALWGLLFGCAASGALLVGDSGALRAWGLFGQGPAADSTWRGVYVLHCAVPLLLAFGLLRRDGGSGE